jgi:hypothetical protein
MAVIKDQARDTFVGGAVKTRAFSINANAKSFEILSGSLYSDKLKAVLREIGTNAADAHVAAGKPNKPFRVHLPNSFEPFFSVYDEGTGISEKDMYELYTTYFSSNKTHSNSFVGCLGLGSKSPFAYCNSFTVKSRFEGVSTTYCCFVGKDGEPNISRMAYTKTSEPSGLEVSFAVDQKDFSKFREAVSVYRHFSVLPEIVGDSNFKLEPVKYSFKNDLFGIVDKSDPFYDFDSYVVCGNIAYPININAIKKDNKDQDYYTYMEILKSPIVLFMPVGSVEPTPSRESLSYTPDTISSLLDMMKIVVENIYSIVSETINLKQNRWEARVAVRKFETPAFSIVCKNGFLWRGERIYSYWKFPTVKEKENKEEVDIFDEKPDLYDIRAEILDIITRTNKINYTKKPVNIIQGNASKIYLLDLPVGNYTRICEDKIRGEVYCFRGEDAAEILDKEGVPYIRTSSLPAPKKIKQYNEDDRSRLKLLYYKNTSFANHREKWVKPPEEDDNDKVYVFLYNFKTFLDAELKTPLEVKYLIRNLSILYGKELSLYGVRPKDKKFTSGMIGVKELVESIYNKTKDELAEIAYFLNNDSNWYRATIIVAEEYGDKFPGPLCEFNKLIKKSREEKNDKRINAFYYIANLFFPNWKNDFSEKNMAFSEMEVIKKYPLIQYLQSDFNGECMKSVFEYLKLMEK